MRIRLSQLRRIIKEEVRRVVAEGPTRTPEEEARFKETQAALRGPAAFKSAAEVRADHEKIKAGWAALTPEERARRMNDEPDDLGGDDEEYEGPDDDSMEVEPGFGPNDPYGPYKQPFGSRGPLVNVGSKYR